MKPTNTLFLVAAIAISALLTTACRRDDPGQATPAAMHTEGSQATPPTNRVDIPPIVRSNLGITFARVERREVMSTMRMPGVFELQPRARREYRMALPGRIELMVDQYEAVFAGDSPTLLYRFRSREWAELQQAIVFAEQEIAAAGAHEELAQARLEEAQSMLRVLQRRIETLAAAEFKRADLEAEAAALEVGMGRLMAEVRLAETLLANAHRTREHALHRAAAAIGARQELLMAEVEHEGRRLPAYLTIDWIDVHAEERGIVEVLAVSDGAFAEPPEVIMSTVDPARVRFRATAMQSDLARLMGTPGPKERQALIVPPRRSGVGMGDAAPALMTIGLEAQADQRTITVLAVPEEMQPWIRPGISAFLEVTVDSSGGPSLAIPRSAIVRDGLTHIFFRRDPRDPNKAIRVEADMGPSDGRWVVINSGLMLSDEVVLDGVYELKLATDQSGRQQRGGHFHADGTWHPDH